MKKINLYLLGALLTATVSSCSDADLDIPNNNAVNTSTFWKTEEDVKAGLNAVYNMFYRQGTWTRNMYTQMNGMADDGVSYAGWSELNEYTKFIFTDYNFAECNTKMYREHYVAINRANQVLDHVDEVEFSDEATREDVRCQAKFLRGFYYFYMTVLWDNLPLTLNTSSADDQPQQATVDEMWEQVQLDLCESIAGLPLRRDPSEYGRPTKGSAYAFLAKAYAQQHKWEEARTCLEWIIDGDGKSLYRLVDNYADNFNENTENNAESLYEIQFALVNKNGFDGTDNAFDSNAQLGTQIEINQSPSGIGWNNIEARPWLVEYFKRELTTDGAYDKRLYTTLWYNGASSDFPDEDNQIYKWSNWNSGWGNRVFIKKYSTDTHVSDIYYWNGNNFRSIRLADMLLLYAEVLNELGGTPSSKAIECVDRVRNRAHLPGIIDSQYYDGKKITSDKTAFREHLKIERALELALECVRWMDLKRWGLDDDSTINEIKKRDPDFENFIIGRHCRMPLPQTEVDNNPNLLQNPEY